MEKHKRLWALCIGSSVLFSVQAYATSDYVGTRVYTTKGEDRKDWIFEKSPPFKTHQEALNWTKKEANTIRHAPANLYYRENKNVYKTASELALLKTSIENENKTWYYVQKIGIPIKYNPGFMAAVDNSFISEIEGCEANLIPPYNSQSAFHNDNFILIAESSPNGYGHYSTNLRKNNILIDGAWCNTDKRGRDSSKDYTEYLVLPILKIYEIEHDETEEEIAERERKRKEREARELKELAEKEELGDSCGNKNNPVNITTGNKYQPFNLPLGNIEIDNTIHYNSKSAVSGLFGKNRTSLFDTHVVIAENKAKIQMPDGQILHLDKQASGDKWSRIDTSLELIKLGDEWVLHDTASQQKLHFNSQGQLVEITLFGESITKLIYTNGVISQALDQYGTAVDLQLNNGLVESISLAGQDNSVSFGYDGKGNLNTITHKADVYEFKFEDTRYPNALTKRLKNGKELGRYGYDEKGLVAYSQIGEETGEENKTTVVRRNTYEFKDDNTTVVTNPLGKKTTYHFKTFSTGNKTVKVEGHKSQNCVASNQEYTYYDNGLVKSQTDWLGHQTTFTYYDDRGLEKARTEATGTPQQRTITTTWHPGFKLPETVTQDKRVMRYTYDDQGQLKSKHTEKKQ